MTDWRKAYMGFDGAARPLPIETYFRRYGYPLLPPTPSPEQEPSLMATLTADIDYPIAPSKPKSAHVQSRTGYFDNAFTEREAIIEEAVRVLSETDFDTIVATGVSGLVVAPILAHLLGKELFVVRKEDDKSTHSGSTHAGILGSRWVFLDDFVSSGATLKRVHRKVTDFAAAPSGGRWEGPTTWIPNVPLQAKFVGIYQYARSEGAVVTAADCGVYDL